MLGVLRDARRLAQAPVSGVMLYVHAEPVRDDMGDMTGEADDSSQVRVFGRITVVDQKPEDEAAAFVRSVGIVMNARCGFTPRIGATVKPLSGPFCNQVFTVSGEAALDAQGANWIMAAVRG